MEKILEDRFYILFARKLSGDASSEELKDLEALLEEHPEVRFFYNELIRPVQTGENEIERAGQSYVADIMNMQLRGVWDNNDLQPSPSLRRKFAGKAYRTAFAAILVLVLGIALIKLPTKSGLPHTNETATTGGSKSTVKLPDGTIVMLNANSKLQYDGSFKTDKREVFLEGEAYFDVAHDAEHPFIIHTSTADITVLGTLFNVKSLLNGYFETALIKGKVSIYLKHHAEGNFVLSPGQKLIAKDKPVRAGKGEEAYKVGSVKIEPITLKDSIVIETSWTKDQLVFVDKPLVEIAEELEQVFKVNIVFKSDKAKQFRYNGVYSDSDLSEILKILNLSKPFSYRREKSTIIIE